MKEVLEVIVKAIVSDKEAVSIIESENDKFAVFQIKVASDDMGRIIGKQGRTIKAIRTLMKTASAKFGTKFMIEVV